MSVGFLAMLRRRGGWLAVLFLGEMLTATAMALFEHQIARAVVLALFVPPVFGSGGNAGSQAATLVVRAVAVGELPGGKWARVLLRELGLGLALGALLGGSGFLRIVLVLRGALLWTCGGPVCGPCRGERGPGPCSDGPGLRPPDERLNPGPLRSLRPPGDHCLPDPEVAGVSIAGQ